MTIKVKWLLVNFTKILRKAGRVLAILNTEQAAVWIRGQKWALGGKSATIFTLDEAQIKIFCIINNSEHVLWGTESNESSHLN